MAFLPLSLLPAFVCRPERDGGREHRCRDGNGLHRRWRAVVSPAVLLCATAARRGDVGGRLGRSGDRLPEAGAGPERGHRRRRHGTLSPVRGLRPSRAARARLSNTPKPASDTDSPDRTVVTNDLEQAVDGAAAVRRSPRRSASASTSWDLFMPADGRADGCPAPVGTRCRATCRPELQESHVHATRWLNVAFLQSGLSCWRSSGGGRAGGLERRDLVGVPQGQADVVEAFQQPPAGVVVDLERHGEVRGLHRLLRAGRR